MTPTPTLPLAGGGSDLFTPRAVHRLAQPIQRHEAAARGAMMAGAEGERGLDLDADPVRRHATAIMRTVHHETANRDRPQPEKAFRDPILGGDALEAQPFGGLGSGRRDG